jgi:hypothetical protein
VVVLGGGRATRRQVLVEGSEITGGYSFDIETLDPSLHLFFVQKLIDLILTHL